MLGPIFYILSEIPENWQDYIADWQHTVLWTVIFGIIIAFVLSFAVGANDCANAFGTAVGSGAMTITMACIIGTICETLGAVFLSGNVIKTITTGIIDIDMYKSTYNNVTDEWTPAPNDTLQPEKSLMIGEIATIVGSSTWQLIATWFAWPVSGTHSVVGGLLGFSLVANGLNGIAWVDLAYIVAWWFISPLASGIMTAVFYWPVRKFIIMSDDPMKYGLLMFPIFWGVAVFVGAGTILTTGNLFPDLTGLDNGPLWGIGAGIGLIVGIIVQILVSLNYIKFDFDNENIDKGHDNPAVIDKDNKHIYINDEEKDAENDKHIYSNDDDNTKVVEEPAIDDDSPECRVMFISLQYLSAITGSIAHGGNNVGNAVGPLVLIWLIYHEPGDYENIDAPYWILLYGGLGIVVGLWVLGYKVIKTMGEDLTAMTPSRGFMVDLMASIVVLICSKLGVPISTTHCKVGSVVAIGLIRGQQAVDMKLFGKIAASWIITIPAAGVVSALLYWILTLIFL